MLLHTACCCCCCRHYEKYIFLSPSTFLCLNTLIGCCFNADLKAISQHYTDSANNAVAAAKYVFSQILLHSVAWLLLHNYFLSFLLPFRILLCQYINWWLLERYYRLYSTNKIEGWYWRQDRYDVSMIVGVSDSSQCYPSAGERMRESLENWVADDNVSTSVLQHTLHTLMITSCRGLDRDHLWSSMGGRSIGW